MSLINTGQWFEEWADDGQQPDNSADAHTVRQTGTARHGEKQQQS